MNYSFAKLFKIINTQSRATGFSLIELLVAMSLTVIVVSLTGFGLVAMMKNNKEAEARTQRRIEINRALDFITDEVRMARNINRTDTTIANGTTVTVSNVVTSSGFSLSALGAYGTIVLYLEIPLTSTTCSGSPSPSYDKVIYDIRSDTNTDPWLGPQVIKRYGRTPGINGTIDPCSNPTTETIIDSISDTNINPTCTSPAVRSGAEGFYACVNGRQVDLYLRSRVSSTEVYNLNNKGFSRISLASSGSTSSSGGSTSSGSTSSSGGSTSSSSTSSSGATSGILPLPTVTVPTLTATLASPKANLSWSWSGSGTPTYKVYACETSSSSCTPNTGSTAIYTGSNTSLSDYNVTNNKTTCFAITATVSGNTSAIGSVGSGQCVTR